MINKPQKEKMSLRQLVNHFNHRFGHEHHTHLRPFLLENGRVSGIFGPIRIASAYSAIRLANNNELLVGHAAQMLASPYEQDINSKLDVDFQSVINLDRLCRTVHMLNYLPYSAHGGVLFLNVDPRHILGIAQNHGVYFEEIIFKCGLTTQNVVISTDFNHDYVLHYEQLLAGLNNYRSRGYQIALNIGNLYVVNDFMTLIGKLSPDYLRITAPAAEIIESSNSAWHSAIKPLIDLQKQLGGLSIIEHVEQKEQVYIVETAGFNLVQGRYYDKLATDHLRCL
jgi:EAL domain-containing protein (putative c-di-GMP-specific phosphodiesterase class I)